MKDTLGEILEFLRLPLWLGTLLAGVSGIFLLVIAGDWASLGEGVLVMLAGIVGMSVFAGISTISLAVPAMSLETKGYSLLGFFLFAVYVLVVNVGITFWLAWVNQDIVDVPLLSSDGKLAYLLWAYTVAMTPLVVVTRTMFGFDLIVPAFGAQIAFVVAGFGMHSFGATHEAAFQLMLLTMGVFSLLQLYFVGWPLFE